ncbi:MAG: EamA family transporter [Hyphomicrobiales bacterium]|nr:MAG: EamA family transporter [Hyphomicrobiales bacterium]
MGIFGRFKSWIALVVLGLVWGATIPLSKIAVSTGHHPFGVIFWQFVVAIIVLGALALALRLRIVINRRTLVFYTILSFVGTLVPNGFSYLAAPHLPAGILGIIIATVPMFALIIALVFRIERLSPVRIIGVALGMIAVVLLVAPEASLPKPGQAVFALLALIAPFFYGIETNYLATQTPKNSEPITTLLMASVIGLFISGILVVVFDAWVDLSGPWEAPEWSLLMASILHAISYAGYIWLVGIAGSVFASQIAYVVTMSAVFIGVLFMGESHASEVWLALGVMIFGVVLVQPKIEN